MSGVEFITITKADDGMRLDRWFKLYVPHMTHGALQKALRKGQVRLDGKKAKANDRVESGQQVRVPPVEKRADVPVNNHTKPKKDYVPNKGTIAALRQHIIFENDDMAVLNKPQGLAVQGGTGQKQNVDVMLPYLFKGEGVAPKLVHRIDKDTTGILVIAKSRKAASQLTELFKKKTVKKRYLAMVVGVPYPEQGEINLPLAKGEVGSGKEKMQVDEKRGQAALSRYRVVDFAHKKAALVELEPVTGRTHQLRVHMAAIGHPIIGDLKYAGKEALFEQAVKKLHLHAWQLELPKSGSISGKKSFEATLPEHLEQVMDLLGLSL